MIKALVWIALGLFVAFVVTLICLADAGRARHLFYLAAQLPAGDKLGHIFLFGMLALLANTALGVPRLQWGSVTILKGSLFVLIPTVLEEFSQLLFRSRTFDVLDLVADGVGIFFGGWLAVLVARRIGHWTGGIPTAPERSPAIASSSLQKD